MLPELRQLLEEERERVQPLLEKGLNLAASYGKLKVISLFEFFTFYELFLRLSSLSNMIVLVKV